MELQKSSCISFVFPYEGHVESDPPKVGGSDFGLPWSPATSEFCSPRSASVRVSLTPMPLMSCLRSLSACECLPPSRRTSNSSENLTASKRYARTPPHPTCEMSLTCHAHLCILCSIVYRKLRELEQSSWSVVWISNRGLNINKAHSCLS